jgi:hypothetical protein
MKLKSLCLLALACMLGLWAVPANAQFKEIITPNQFQMNTWGSNILSSSADAYSGDTATITTPSTTSAGYYYTNNYSNSPSATVVVPLGAMPAGWNAYDIYEWVPNVNNTSATYQVVNIGADGGAYEDNPPTEPWAGQFGTNQQWLSENENQQGGWVELGPGPQSDSTNDSGYGVWIEGNSGKGNPYLQIHYLGFENTPETFDAFAVVSVGTPVPEPGTLTLLAAGGAAVLLLVRRRRRA